MGAACLTVDPALLLLVLAASLAAAAAVLGTTFLVARRVGKHAVVDVAWGLGFVAVALVSWLVTWLDDGDGSARSALLLVLVALWGVRLAAHIGLRSRGKGEDPRYDALLDRETAQHPGRSRDAVALRRIYATQAAALWFISLPVQVAAVAPDTSPGPLAVLGVAVWAVGLFFEAVGDWQLQRFRDDPGNRGQVLDTGLWRYTRHPNYFGDACAWWGLFLVAAEAWPGVLTVLSPVAMTWLLAKGTGAALLEKDIGDRRPEYAEYVRRTSGFVPLPPKPSRR